MCKVFKVDRTSYYSWMQNGCIVKKIDHKLNNLVESLFIHSRCTYGTRRLKYQLFSKYGLIISRRRLSKIMRYLNLSVKLKRKFRATTNSNHNLPIAPNLLQRDFYSNTPDTKYVGDITYIQTQQGWLYLATVIDLYSRKVVGWSMDDNMKTSLVNDALNMAIQRRRPQVGLIWHTDRGSQYASYEHRDLLHKHGIVQSMSRKGNCWDNAVSESFFHTLKTELVYNQVFFTKSQANQAIFEYIEVFYNKERIHSANDNLSPVEFEYKMLKSNLVA